MSPLDPVPCPLSSVRIIIPEASVSLPAIVTPPTSSSSLVVVDTERPPSPNPVEDSFMSVPRNQESSDDDDEDPARNRREAEKIGRWSEYEHLVFLDGLKRYGKQWKTIAGMIGTRTVVQVRTHAQKYFQKVDRDVPLSSAAKRKSPLSRKSRKLALRRAISVPTTTTMTSGNPPPSLELPSFSSSLSKSSSSTGSDENWSTISPNTVVQLVERPNDDAEEEEWDPLEWLIETDGTHYLPESSLPLFPFDKEEEEEGMHGVEVSEEMREMDLVQDAILHNMVDPNVTMQSLFLEEDQ